MHKDNLLITVEFYTGYRGEESHGRFFFGNKRVEVKDILDRWLTPDYQYFKVKGDDEGVYILRHDAGTDRWELTLFDSGKHVQTQLSTT